MYIQNFSIRSALGNTGAETLGNLARNTAPGLKQCDGWLQNGETAVLGCVEGDFPAIPKEFTMHQSRNNQIILALYEEIRESVEHAMKEYGAERVAVVLGTSTSGSDEADRYITKLSSGEKTSFDSYAQELGAPSRFLSSLIGAKGPCYTISTACTSSTRAFISAERLLKSGIAEAVIVGGVDTLARMPINGFNALGAFSKTCCKPFAGDRCGITIGEGGALFLVTNQKSSLAMVGYGESSDGHHMTAPDPEGKGAQKAMQEALERAGLRADQIDYLNLHGTGTQLNDAAEARAVSRVFGKVFCSSTKSLTGHTLGAAGAVEAALACILLESKDAVIPVQMQNGDQYDKTLPSIGIITEPKRFDGNYVMTNNFAFGGNNASLIFARVL